MNNLVTDQLRELESKEQQYVALAVKAECCTLDAFAVLRDIRDAKLFRARGYSTFVEYAKTEWDLSESHSYRMMDAVGVREKLASFGYSQYFRSERSLRELKEVPDSRLEEVAKRAVSESDSPETGVSGKFVKTAKKQLLGAAKKTSPSGGEKKRDALNVSAEKIAQSSKIASETLGRLIRHLGILGLADEFAPTLKKIERRLPK